MIDMTGHRRGRLVAVRHIGRGFWLCRCDCGQESEVTGTDLRETGDTGIRSCGCLKREMYTPRHRLEQRYVKSPTGCWLWTGVANNSGYGRIVVNDVLKLAHRVSYEIYVGPIPDGMCLCHRCDVRLCVNPDHLFLGTRVDNTADMVAKGRQAIGDRQSKAKLTYGAVAEIRRRAGEDRKRLAAEYGVSVRNIRAILIGETWRYPAAGWTGAGEGEAQP